jgi:hypothetical protein
MSVAWVDAGKLGLHRVEAYGGRRMRPRDRILRLMMESAHGVRVGVCRLVR